MSDLYMMTFSGKKFYPKKPTPNEVDIHDIARSLSMMNRFCGHTKFPYSVARHSINCANIAPEGYKLEALLHDATEAYLSDIVMPAKRSLPEYEIMENEIFQYAIAPKFGLNNTLSPVVKHIDKVMCVTEAYQLLQDYSWIYDDYWPERNRSIVIEENYWRKDMEDFLELFSQLS